MSMSKINCSRRLGAGRDEAKAKMDVAQPYLLGHLQSPLTSECHFERSEKSRLPRVVRFLASARNDS